MSTIRADYISPSAGGTSKSLVRGTAAAWVNFNGTGTIAARDSENVSSLTDNGTGDYTASFINSFAAVDYVHTATCGNDNIENTGFRGINLNMNNSSTSAGRILSAAIASTINRTSIDDPFVLSVFHGDLA